MSAGTAAEEIPIEGRIAAVADVFDALTSKRVYKPAFTIEKALTIIQEEQGKQFDPRVAAAFMEARDEIEAIHDAYRELPNDAP